MNEIWKDIPGFEGLYQVSTEGRVRSLDRYRLGKRGSQTFVKGRIMSLNPMRNGYRQIYLSNGDNGKMLLVHRLVALAFLDNPLKLRCVDHINGVRHDNRLINLRWCTHSENHNFPLAQRNQSQALKNSVKAREHLSRLWEKRRRPIVIVFPNGEIREYASAYEAEKDGFYHVLIAACCRGRQKTHRNCKCYYKEDFYGNNA